MPVDSLALYVERGWVLTDEAESTVEIAEDYVEDEDDEESAE